MSRTVWSMARPIDSDRWDDPASVFIPYTNSERAVREKTNEGQDRSVGQILSLLRDDAADDPTGALAALLLAVVRGAQLDADVVEPTIAADVRTMMVSTGATVSGTVRCADDAELVAILRSLTDEIAISGPLARILYSRIEPTAPSLQRSLSQLASKEALSACLAGPAATGSHSQGRAERRRPRPSVAAIDLDDEDLTKKQSPSGSTLARSAIIFAVVALSVAFVGSIALNAARAQSEPIASQAQSVSPDPPTIAASAASSPPVSAANTAESVVRGGAAFDHDVSVVSSNVVVLRERLAVLDRARSESFANPQQAALATVDAAGSPALKQDSDLLARLRSAKARLEGGAQTVESITPISITDDVATLRVVDRQGSYQVVREESGDVLDRRQESPKQSWIVTLHRQHGQWLYYQAVAASK